MKPVKAWQMCIVVLVAFSLISCGSGSDSPNTPTNTPSGTTSTSVFKWTENGSATEQTATTANFSTQFKTLKAYNGTTLVYEINLDGTTPATYTLNANNAITYIKSTQFFTPTAGNVIITANANSKVSGTFAGTGTAVGGVTSVAGTFTDITVVP
jgi:hypothetical protein